MGGTGSPLIVLCYHRVCVGDRWMSPETFDGQLRYLAARCDVVDVPEVVRLLRSGARPTRPTVCITFDDGWADTLEVALPLLIRHGLSATLFAATGLVDGGERGEGARFGDTSAGGLEFTRTGHSHHFLTWNELEQLGRSGHVRIEAHGHNHLAFFGAPHVEAVFDGIYRDALHTWTLRSAVGEERPGTPIYSPVSLLGGPRYFDSPALRRWAQELWPRMRNRPFAQARMIAACRQLARSNHFAGRTQPRAEWLELVRDDLRGCLDRMEQRLGYRPRYLAWPYGWWRADGLEAAREVGLSDTFAVTAHYDDRVSPDEPLPRMTPPSTVDRLRQLVEEGPAAHELAVARAQRRLRFVARGYDRLVSGLEHVPVSLLVPIGPRRPTSSEA